MACNVEDAGFILKDCIMWLYGSGFPKTTDISKQIDKMAGKKRVKGEKKKNFDKYNSVNYKKVNAVEYAGRKEKEKVGYESIPATPEATLWDGWKSHGLKPAYEPILVAMKPNEGSYANNALKWGVAGLNIDGGRIGTDEETGRDNRNIKNSPLEPKDGWNENSMKGLDRRGLFKGRFPANIILDEEAARLLDEQSGERKAGGIVKGNEPSRTGQNGFNRPRNP